MKLAINHSSMDLSPTSFLKQAITTAEHFGFRSVDELRKDPACQSCGRLAPQVSAQLRRTDDLHGLLTSGLNTFCASRFNGFEKPVLFYTIEQVPRSGETAIAFHIYNVPESIAEAILIHVSRALSLDLGFSDSTVRLNSLGDKESSNRYVRELTNFMRKRIDDMPDSARELMKDHALTALAHLIDKGHDLSYRAPSPLEYLSDHSRRHFREIIEYLDMAELAYEIDPKLIGHHECYSDALFSIELPVAEDTSHSPLTIRGGRYSEFVQRTTKKSINAAGAVAVLRDRKAPSRVPRVKLYTPTVAVVQLGFGPKIKSLILVDQLRSIGVPVYQDLPNNSLSAQLRAAESAEVPYVILIGQKEFVEGTVILRDMEARSQEIVDIPTLLTKFRRSKRVATV